ncbi:MULTISPECIES: type II secretion system F family protein [Paraburkholderia]|jgi:tight adherence protein C|uniref:type II secretion system F family protein n=1 Tax=Paraburkholderia TaxID=1822464 RepID=UPI0022531976|nr:MULTISPECIES: type II secretion system F family protein [Paraburkholderia]MCX4156756.1 type II secretion system F family protein [Paraburkholderia aspalathi]MDN7166161.1 type II secretion system F family protein [Paraburkholderia sp. SECH2]MDQ6394647.1 type II secretion system F family protein [Paraburkholderia aspalathi]
MEAQHVAAIALALAALGLLLIAALLVVRLSAARRSERTLTHALDERALQSAALTAAARGGERADTAAPARGGQPAGWKRLFERFAHAGVRWLDTPLGRQIVAEEDRRLLEQCGFVDTRMRGLFLMARILGMAILPLVAGMLARDHVSGSTCVVIIIAATLAGFMVPKIYVARRASRRRNGVIEELPLMVDLLRLLQGVGLSLDQSLQVMVSDFRTVLPVLSHELEIAQRQFAAGRPRDQSLNRLAASYDNEDLRAVVRLLIQVDRHGGAVQEPLKLFGDRLREARRAMLRERIGRLTVKMTGVMIVTLLPALMIVTAGPGVLAVTKSLHSTQR